MTSKVVHGTCISIDGKGVLLLGAAGAGKSDLALRLIDHGARLVSDDQVEITLTHKKSLTAAPPANIEGLFEVRGVGIFQMQYEKNAPLVLGVNLVGRNAVARMPDLEVFDCHGVQVPLLSLHAFDASTCAKIRLFLQTV